MERFGLRDDQWDRIKDILPGREGHVGGTAPITGCSLKRFCTGSGPVCHGATCRRASAIGRACISASAGGAKSGVFDRIFRLLASDADNEYMMIDRHHCARPSTQRRRPKKDGDQAIGRSRGGLTTKIHALVDALGNPPT